MAPDDPFRLPLTAVLLRPSTDPVGAWTDESRPGVAFYQYLDGVPHALARDDIKLIGLAASPGDVIIAFLRRPKPPVAWLRFLRDRAGLEVVVANGDSFGAAVFCAIVDEANVKAGMSWVGWLFGSAAKCIRRSAQDPRFGLLVALNLLTATHRDEGDSDDGVPDKAKIPRVREMRYRSYNPYVQQTGHRAARDIPVDGFRVDRSSDLVAAIGGRGADPALTTSTLLGGRSLRFRAGISSIEDLAQLAVTALKRSRDIEYKEAFEWIDHVVLVDDQAQVTLLRGELVSQLKADPDRPTLDAILPDDLLEVGADRSIDTISFPHERQGAGRRNLTIGSIAHLISTAPDQDYDRMLDASLRFYDEAGGIIGSATVLECISGDLRFGDGQFIVYDGDFYRVDASFARRIDGEVSRIAQSDIVFPRYDGGTEPAYIDAVRDDHSDAFIVLDRALIRVEGEAGVESSDLVAPSGALIHLKRKGKSSKLSHLFLQVANSCELLRRSDAAQEQLAAMVAGAGRNDDIITAVQMAHDSAWKNRDEIEVVFAFLGDWKGKTINSLPFFSRISLVSESRRVASLGFRPTVATISSR